MLEKSVLRWENQILYQEDRWPTRLKAPISAVSMPVFDFWPKLIKVLRALPKIFPLWPCKIKTSKFAELSHNKLRLLKTFLERQVLVWLYNFFYLHGYFFILVPYEQVKSTWKYYLYEPPLLRWGRSNLKIETIRK